MPGVAVVGVLIFAALALATVFIANECQDYGKPAIGRAFDVMTVLFGGIALGIMIVEMCS